MLKKILTSCFIILFSLSSPTAIASIHEGNPYDFSVTKIHYKSADIYQVQSPRKETYPGTIKKSAFRIRTNYDLSNKNGWQATGISRILSLGSLFPWAKAIDIYDTRGVKIGFIDGNITTLDAAKFSIYEYDEAGESTQIGIAYANLNFDRFEILKSRTNPHAIADLTRNFSNRTWDVSVHYPELIDDRIIRIFAAFVIDHEDKFSKKPKKNKIA